MSTVSCLHDAKFTPWWWEAAPPADRSALPLPKQTDVLIVGSGYTGLSAALTLARAGRDVLVCEAGVPGYGASTRNGGQLGSGNQKFPVAKLVAMFGERKTHELINEGVAMLRFICKLIRGEGIECHLSQVGRFRGAVHPDHYEAMARDMEYLRRYADVDSFMVPRAEQHREVDTDIYHGGSVLPGDAALHPGLYHRGLMQCVETAGARVVSQTPVIGLEKENGCIRVRTARGEVQARNVIVATNGYTGKGVPLLRRRIVPIGTSMIATEELEPDRVTGLLPTGRVYGNTARVFHYYRPTPDGRRLLWGGRIGRLAPQDHPRAFTHIYKDMLRVFPSLEGTRIIHCWSGFIGYTADVFPHIGCHDGIHYATGYCGTGVSRSTYFGRKVALKVLGDADGRTAFDDLDFRRFRLHFFSPLGVPLVESWYRLRDALQVPRSPRSHR